MSSSRQRLPSKTRQPRNERWQGRKSDSKGAFRVEEEVRQIAQDIGIADRSASIRSQRSGIAEGGARTWLVRVDDNDLPASGGQPKRRSQANDSGPYNCDVGLDRGDHGCSDRAGDLDMTGVQELGHDRERVPQLRMRGRSGHIDAHCMNRSLASNRESVGRQHADATLTTGPGETGAAPGFRQVQPGVRRRLLRLHIEADERIAHYGLTPAQLLALEVDDPPRRSIFKHAGRHQRG